jgi:hypothetical protein
MLLYQLRERRGELLRAVGLVVVGAAPILALDLVYNAHTRDCGSNGVRA